MYGAFILPGQFPAFEQGERNAATSSSLDSTKHEIGVVLALMEEMCDDDHVVAILEEKDHVASEQDGAVSQSGEDIHSREPMFHGAIA